jgi:phage shock protein A
MRGTDRVDGSRLADISHLLARTGASDEALGTLALSMERAAFQLRRDTVTAVARQRRLREETLAARALADVVECRALRALESGDAILARQILAREMCTLKSREALEDELSDADRCVSELVGRLMQTEDRARLLWKRKEDLAKGGRGC